MNNFKNYSAYYNLFYANKDYEKEASYINQLIKTHHPKAKNILNLGCGTGKHDIELAKLGYYIMGVDLSKEMITIAKAENPDTAKIKFKEADVRTLRLNKKYDVVVALFHVMSYQTTNEDLFAIFETAKVHLNKGGIFIFDCWYGPGVLSDPPVSRIRRLQNANVEILRLAEPVQYYDKNIVDVNYEIRVKDKKNLTEEIINETHTIRYLFLPEITIFSKGFIMLNNYTWLTTNTPKNDWYIVSILQKMDK